MRGCDLQKPTPSDRFHYERLTLDTGVRRIAGVDEAGRGPLAGPVVAAAVVLPADWFVHSIPPELAGLNDSKQLTAAQRDRYFELLSQNPAIQRAVARVDAEVIDRINILQATHCAMNQALATLQPPPQHVLVDGWRVKSMVFPQTALVHGDARSYSIAAASVLAKVTRDRLMCEYDHLYPNYGFAHHKGYATPQHLDALARLGPSPIHRRTFAPIKPTQPKLL